MLHFQRVKLCTPRRFHLCPPPRLHEAVPHPVQQNVIHLRDIEVKLLLIQLTRPSDLFFAEHGAHGIDNRNRIGLLL